MIKSKFLHPGIALAFLVLLAVSAAAQDRVLNGYTDISRLGATKDIKNIISSTYISRNEDPEKIFSKLTFAPGLRHNRSIPNEFVTKKAVLKFNICNNADTAASIYFFPGFYFTEIQVYRIDSGGIKKLRPVLPPVPDSIGFRMITLEAHDSATILAELSFVKTYINSIQPRLINKGQVTSFLASIHIGHDQDNMVTYIFCGLLLMMVLFSMTNFFQGANRDFLYYSGYAFFLGFMLLTKALYGFRINPINFFFEGYLDFILQALGIIFYLLFMQRFLETHTRHPFLFRLYNTGIIMLIFSMLLYTWFHYFTDIFFAENLVENATKLLLLLMVIIFLSYSIRKWDEKLMRYLYWGNLLLFIFAVISQATVMLDNLSRHLPGVLNSSLFYYEIGLFLELVFFLAGLNFKNRSQIIAQTKERETLKAQNQMKEYEKEIAVYKAQQEERERISADMHDELGSGMTAIRLMSEIARNKMKENTPVEIDKISASADDVLNKMNAIIWSMNSRNDTLDNLISYIRSYALEYFENTPIECRVQTPERIPARELTGDKRRNLFLCIKETLNNGLKHSKASLITITIQADQTLVITIADNGIGTDTQQVRQFGNGLKNMARRMESISGTYKIETRNGTVTTLELPL